MTLVPTQPDGRHNWIALMGPAGDLASKIAETEFVPGKLRKRPAAVLAAILTGDEVGIGPLQALRQIFVTEDGKVGMAAELMRSLILRDGHECWADDYTTTRVTMCGRRAGSQEISKVTWTMDDAKRAGLDQKQNWRRYPRAMLTARATTELARLLFPDVIAGISHSLEELQDDDIVDAGILEDDEPKSKPPRKTAQRSTPAARARPRTGTGPTGTSPSGGPLPPLPGEEEAEAPKPEPGASGMPVDQEIAMAAREAGLDHHLVIRAVTYGRKSSAKELDGAEAIAVKGAIKGIAEKRMRLAGDGGMIYVDTLQGDEDEGIEDAEVVEESTGPWTEEQWRAAMEQIGVRASEVLRQAARLALDYGKPAPVKLAALIEMPELALAVRKWLEEQ